MVYQLKVITKAGCEWISRFYVHVTDDFPVFIPTGFSPNKDGINDKFRIYFAEDKGIIIEQMNLYDRWGNQVYACINSECEWDGTYKGMDLNPGIFIYQIHLRTLDGTLIIKKGEVSLMR
jgi:gliding motility-associated-like protein